MPTDAEIARYRAVFDSLDLDKTGSLTIANVAAAYQSLGMDAGDMDELEELLKAGDLDGDGELTFPEFVHVLEHRSKAEEGEEEEEHDDEEESSDGEGGGDVLEMLSEEDAHLYAKLFHELDFRQENKLTSECVQETLRNQTLRHGDLNRQEVLFYFALIEAADNSPALSLGVEDVVRVGYHHPEFIAAYRRRIGAGAPLGLGRKLASLGSISAFEVDSDGEYDSDGDGDAPNARSASFLGRADGEQLAQLRSVFQEFDKDSDGRIAHAEIQAAMDKLGRVPTPQESEFVFTLLAMGGEEGLTFEEFASVMLESPDAIGAIGRSVSTWKCRQSHHEQARTNRLLRNSISRLGLSGAIAREDARISRAEDERLQRLNAMMAIPEGDDEAGDSGGGQPAPVAVSVPSSRLLTPVELRRYQAVFNRLDKNLDGEISTAEFGETIKGVIGRQPTQQEIEQFIAEADTSLSGSMNFEEFVAIMLKTKRNVQERKARQKDEAAEKAAERARKRYRLAFDRFDADKNGHITAQELMAALEALGKKPTLEGCKKLIRSVDNNDNEELEFDEFVRLMDGLMAKRR